MHIKVTFPGSFTVFNPEDAGAFLKALANSQVIDSSGWGKDEKLSISKSKPTIELIDPVGFAPLPEPLVELQEQLRASESLDEILQRKQHTPEENQRARSQTRRNQSSHE